MHRENFCALIQRRKNKEKRTVGKLNKKNMHGGRNSSPTENLFFFFFRIN